MPPFEPRGREFKAGYTAGKRDGFHSGRRVGIYTAYNYIFPIPVNLLSKDLAREAAGLAGMTSRGTKSIEELKQYLRDHQYNAVIFKKSQNGNYLELVKK